MPETKIAELCSSLIELDHDAIEAYEAAIDRLDDAEARQQLTAFLQDHQRHVQELSEVVREHGAEPPSKGDVKRVLTKGKVQLGSLAGDEAILKAMKSNEDETNEKYEKALRHEGLPSGIEALLRRNLEDERRHRRWIEDRLARA